MRLVLDLREGTDGQLLVPDETLHQYLYTFVELDVTQGECDGDPYGIALFAGQVSRNSTDSDDSGRSLRYAPGYPMIMQDRLPAESLRGPFYHEQRLLQVPKKATLKMDVSADGVRSYVNDKLITHSTYPINTAGHIQFGRYAGDTFTGHPEGEVNYKVTALRIQWQKPVSKDEVKKTEPL